MTSAPQPLIIAEAGVNHDGRRAKALDLVHAAAECGADVVKFQVFRGESLVTKAGRTAPYQANNTGLSEQRTLLDGLELGIDDFAVIAAECRKTGIEFLCSPFEDNLTGRLLEFGMRRIKVASGEITNVPALRQFASHRVPVILSTGMSTMDEVGAALGVLTGAGCNDVTLLHCTSLYPAPVATANLLAMTAMRERFKRPVGYSDHTAGDAVAVAATALGAAVIEKHLTLDRNAPGPDHRVSLEPTEFRAMAARIREAAAALGDGIKRPAPGEEETARLVRRSWHAARDLAAGAVLGSTDAALKRPTDGLSPDIEIVGRRLARALRTDDPIRAEDLL